MGNGNDRINIYDGPNTNSPLLATISGNILPNSAIISSSNSITIQQISDGIGNSSGFILEWNCISTVSKPIANFYTSDTNSCNTTIKFYNLSTQAVNNYWDFGDGSYSTKQNPTHTYLQDGIYTVKLLISNTIGQDSIIKNNYVNISQLDKPIISDAIRCNEGEIKLECLDTNNTIYWYDNNINTNYLHTGNTFNTFIDTTRTFYASQKQYYPPLSFGKLDTNGNGSFTDMGSNKGITFDVLNSSKLISVDVYTNINGDRSIFLFNSANELINSKTLFLNYGKNTINLDWDLQQGINYKILTNAYSGLYHSTSNISFPYTDANNSIILKSDSSNSNYFYFYNWKLQNKFCISPKTEIKAIVSDTLKPQPLFELSAEDPSIQLNNKSNYSSSYYWDFGDGDFSLLESPNHTYSNNGLYEIKLIASNDCGIKSYTKNLQIINTSIQNIDNYNNIKLFPNPVTNIINIEFNTIFRNNISIKLFNTLGQEIKNTTIYKNSENSIISINTKNIQRGIYIILIETDSKIISRKVILE
jgi:PKD repeat protein